MNEWGKHGFAPPVYYFLLDVYIILWMDGWMDMKTPSHDPDFMMTSRHWGVCVGHEGVMPPDVQRTYLSFFFRKALFLFSFFGGGKGFAIGIEGRSIMCHRCCDIEGGGRRLTGSVPLKQKLGRYGQSVRSA